MTKNELEQRLIEENIPQLSYSLNGGHPNEACCLSKNGQICKFIIVKEGLRPV